MFRFRYFMLATIRIKRMICGRSFFFKQKETKTHRERQYYVNVSGIITLCIHVILLKNVLTGTNEKNKIKSKRIKPYFPLVSVAIDGRRENYRCAKHQYLCLVESEFLIMHDSLSLIWLAFSKNKTNQKKYCCARVKYRSVKRSLRTRNKSGQ